MVIFYYTLLNLDSSLIHTGRSSKWAKLAKPSDILVTSPGSSTERCLTQLVCRSMIRMTLLV